MPWHVSQVETDRRSGDSMKNRNHGTLFMKNVKRPSTYDLDGGNSVLYTCSRIQWAAMLQKKLFVLKSKVSVTGMQKKKINTMRQKKIPFGKQNMIQCNFYYATQ